MKERGPATEQDVVDAFIRAELVSPRFRAFVVELAARLGLDSDRLLDAEHADARRSILWQYRDQFLEGFPRGVVWRRVELEAEDWPRLRYSSYPTWVTLSGGSRRVIDGAANVDRLQVPKRGGGWINDDVRSLAAAIERGERFPELIAVEGEGDTLTLVEGHTRATGFALAAMPRPVALLLGRSPNLPAWRWY